jgi:hypothetical protein
LLGWELSPRGRAPRPLALNLSGIFSYRMLHDRFTEGCAIASNLNVCKLDPLEDSRWDRFVASHPLSSAFHTSGWLTALQRTYGYEPIVYTTTAPSSELENGIVFCRVKSWLSGFRLVSLPFSDHCQPLVNDPRLMTQFIEWLEHLRQHEHWKYLELRLAFVESMPIASENIAPAEEHCLQILDLRPDLDTLFRGFHKSCVQRKIHRAEREGLIYEEGRSDAILAKFYFLLILTRRRHGLPPQPLTWFRNLLSSVGDRITIRVVSKGPDPVASILTIFHKTTLVYKYGCSDARFNNLGGTALLFWKAIQDAKRNGAERYDLGRSESDQPGLISFKKNWGATSFPLRYYRLPPGPPVLARRLQAHFIRNIFSRMPDPLLTAIGKLLYRHIG